MHPFCFSPARALGGMPRTIVTRGTIMIGTETREDLMTAREHIYRAVDARGDANLSTAAALIDRALKDLCPHLRATWHIAVDDRGRPRTTCYACGMWWYDHGDPGRDAPAAAARRLSNQQEEYLDYLDIKLRIRERDHGHAYLTPFEAERLLARDLRQPGHTVHRFSTFVEDRSDATLAARALGASHPTTTDAVVI
jgi:hypothetical protein